MLPALGIALLVALAHAPELLGIVSSNPAYVVSGLGVLPHGSPLPAVPGWIDPNAGFTTQALGGYAAREWLAGRVPWWNPYSGVGMPLAAEAQASALFLPFVLLLRFWDGVLYLKMAMQVLAGWAMLALLAELGVSVAASAIAAGLFALSGTFAWFAHGPIMPIPFLPLLLFGIERARKPAGGWRWAAVALGWSILAGFPETAYIDGLLAAAWAVLRLVQAGRARARLGWRLACAAGTGLLLAAPQIGPLLQLLGRGAVGAHDGVARYAMAGFVHVIQLVPLALGPLYAWGYGDWGSVGGYVGLPLVAVAALALAGHGPERALRWLLAGWTVVTYAKATGLPLATDLVNLVPLIARTMFARQVQPTWQAAAAILAALALDDWRRGTAPGARTRAALLLALGIATLAAAYKGRDEALRVLHEVEHAWVVAAGALGWCALVLAVVFASLAVPPTRRRLIAVALALAFDALVQFSAPLAAGVRDATLDPEPVAFLRAHLGLRRFVTTGPFAPNYGALFGVASVNHNALPVPRAWVEHIHDSLDRFVDDSAFTGNYPPPLGDRLSELRRALPAYAALGVRYVAAAPGSAILGPSATPAFRGRTLDLYEIPNAAAYWETTGGACTLDEATREAVVAHCARPATLIRRELDYPGWRATVDGQPVAVERAEPLFQSAPLPAGTSRVRFRYAPPGEALWWGLCGAGLLLLALGAVPRRVDRPLVRA